MLLYIHLLLQSVQPTDTVRIKERICRDCRVSASVVVTLATDAGGAVDRNPVVARDGAGNYWVTSERAKGTIDVFDSQGRRLHSVGRSGKGPGEFGHIGVMTASPSGIEAFDWVNNRWTTIGLDYRIGSMRPVTLRPRSAVITRSGAIVAANLGTAEATGNTLHLIDTAGRVARSFSKPSQAYQPYFPTPFFRNLSLSEDGGAVWSAHFGEYVFERCDLASAVCGVYARSVPWFEPGLGVFEPSHTKAPTPLFIGVSTDGLNALWTATLVADQRWKEAVEQSPGTRGPDGLIVTDMSKYFDTIVERIDLRTGSTVATHRIDAAILQFIGPGLGFSFREDKTSGLPRIDIIKVTYVQPR